MINYKTIAKNEMLQYNFEALKKVNE